MHCSEKLSFNFSVNLSINIEHFFYNKEGKITESWLAETQEIFP